MALTQGASGTSLNYSSGQFTTQAALDAAYPTGTYTFTYSGSAGSGTESGSFTQNLYPDTSPLLSQTTFNGLQGMDPSRAFQATWNSFSLLTGLGGSVVTYNPQVGFYISDANGNFIYKYDANSLNGSSLTSATIPAGKLLAGATYQVELFFDNDLVTRGDSDPSYAGYNSHFTTYTTAVFTAAPEPSQNAALGLGVLGLAGLALKARQRKVAVKPSA